MDPSEQIEGKILCEICEKTFSTIPNMSKHIGIVHGEAKNFECNVCSNTFGKKYELEKHVEIIHFAISCTFHFSRESETIYDFLARLARNARNEKNDEL